MFKQVIEKLTELGKELGIKTVFVQDIYQINNNPDISYPVLVIESDETRETLDLWQYRFRLTYIDILAEDQSNLIDIQSTGMELLSKLLRNIPENWNLTSSSYRTFLQRFNDECSGVYCWITLEVPKEDIC